MIRDPLRFAAAVLLCCVGGGGAMAAMPAAAAEPSPPAAQVAAQVAEVRLPQSRQWTQRATGSGREYAVFVAIPDGPAPAGGYATIYVLDGNALFLTAAEAVRAYARRRDPERDTRAIVVGIGYPDGVDIPAARTFDMTPPVQEPRSRYPAGGADAFLAFIEDDLKPRIAREFAVDPRRQALMGHSFGGLFTLYTLTRRPQAFQTYVGMSSSFWFGGHDLSTRVAAFAQARGADAEPLRVLMTAGEFEQRPSPEDWARDPERASKAAADLAQRGQVVRAREAAQQLAQAPHMLVDMREIAGEDHGTVIPAAIGRGVDFILNGPRDVPPVPTAQAYMALGPEGRYRLRLTVRALPDPNRIPWLNALKANLKHGLDAAQRKQLHDERQQMDASHGSQPHQVNADQ